jgi:S1-C subfamily serine protease/regulator of sirC expression with transglutaminase-like and TPR domain
MSWTSNAASPRFALRAFGAALATTLILLHSCGAGALAGEDAARPEPTATSTSAAQSQSPELAPEPAEQTVQQIAELARKSVVEVTFSGRDGRRQGLGTGFVIGADGLIATNLHVLGEARPIAVRFANGKNYDVETIHASDRKFDLAIIKIKARDLPVLELGNSDQLRDGQSVVAVGNPHGLKNSVVSGVVSGHREINDRPMIQLAIPIEPGNSGGPLLDLFGRVHGILTMKSLVTNNLGFAVPINSLKPLIDKPNSVPMSRWLTIGALDPAEWSMPHGGRWRQHSGRILASEPGSGFGGRALCLSELEVPEMPYEVAVTVRLDDEAGAAGLVFAADGNERHYGFYPSGGKLRLTRFDGADVYSWKVLSEQANEAYQPGDWNTLKVRVEPKRLVCYVNDKLHLELTDDVFRDGQVGLAKFRQTEAEFKQFRLAREIPSNKLNPKLAAKLTKTIARLPLEGDLNEALIERFLPEAEASSALLIERAKQLEQQAEQLKRLAQTVHQRRVQAELVTALGVDEEKIDLFRACLLISQLDNEELDVDESLKDFDRLARGLKASVPADASDEEKIRRLNKYLFEEQGFHGSRFDYYSRSNSYLNEVLDDREGLPITLSVLYLELASRLGLKMSGVGLPGHFVVQHHPAEGESQLIDVYEQGKLLSRDEASEIVRHHAGRDLIDGDLTPASKRSIVLRMLGNLRGIASENQDSDALLKYLDTVLAIVPDSVEERSLRAVVRTQAGNRAGALTDVDWLLEKQPDGIDLDRVREFRRFLEQQE